jgi:hypothetical protein
LIDSVDDCGVTPLRLFAISVSCAAGSGCHSCPAGAGRCLHHADLTLASVSREIDVALEDARYRDSAAAIAAEIAAMPSARDALPALTALADRA